MAGRIKASDVEEVKRRTNIADLVGDYVALKSAGIDSMKGLCPFHDERSPSFHVRPALGYFHCFGCGESGDAISFIQKMDHLSFTETIERLAARIHYQLTYEEGSGKQQDGPNRARLLAANHAAAEYFITQLSTDEAVEARAFLEQRGFAPASWEMFGVGYAPRGWDSLTNHLKKSGYTPQELVSAGLVSEGNRGVYDRFRGRIIWPIRDTSGQTLGFGARKLYEDDQGPKYLNTPESPVYQKSRVLYGIDLAKRAISRGRKAVIVEGYTDVMACHLAGVDVAVATCGTAFGGDHITMLRRMMGDDAAAEVIFTFDPDEAGQKAALRAFSEEQRFTAQTYAAVAPEGFDPADLRLHRGDSAVHQLFENKVPLFEFALKQAIARFDLNSVEGRVSALREAAPIIAGIKDQAMRPGYTRELARMLGVDLPEVQHAIRTAQQLMNRAPQDRIAHTRGPQQPQQPQRMGIDPPPAPRPAITLATLQRNHVTLRERDALMAMIQQGPEIGSDLLEQAVTAQVTEPQLRVVRDALAQALPQVAGGSWAEAVLQATPMSHQSLVRELAVAPLPQRDPNLIVEYAREIVISLLDSDLVSLKQELLSRMQRLGDPSSEASRRIQEQLAALENARRALRQD